MFGFGKNNNQPSPEPTNNPPDPVRLHLMALPPGIVVAIDAAMATYPDACVIEVRVLGYGRGRKGLKATLAFDIAPNKPPRTDSYGRTLPESNGEGMPF